MGMKSFPHFLFVFGGCHAETLFEAFAEVTGVVDAYHIGYLGHVEFACFDELWVVFH